MKTCKSCRITKPLGEFYLNNRAADGKTSECKPCHLAAVKASQRASRDATQAGIRVAKARLR